LEKLNNKTILNQLAYITFLSETIPLLFCIIFFKKINHKTLKVFFIYTFFLALFSIASIVSIYFNKNLSVYIWLLKLFSVFEFFLFSLFVYYSLENKFLKKIILILNAPFLSIHIISWLFFKNESSVYPYLFEFLIFIIFIIYFFYEKMKLVNKNPIYNNTEFWIFVGIFMFFSGNFFYLLFSNSNYSKQFKYQLQIVVSIVTIIKNIIFSLSFLIKETPQITNNSISYAPDLDLEPTRSNTN
jgi:hypothetical protein